MYNYIIKINIYSALLNVAISLTFDNNCVGHDPSTIDVAPASAAADARRAADVLHPEPEAPEARRPHRNLQGSRCLLKGREKNLHFFRHKYMRLIWDKMEKKMRYIIQTSKTKIKFLDWRVYLLSKRGKNIFLL